MRMEKVISCMLTCFRRISILVSSKTSKCTGEVVKSVYLNYSSYLIHLHNLAMTRLDS